MAPIRRYLRITKYSVLEVRIYLDKPSDAPWLLSSRDRVLARIIEEIRPKVLPKLREENENAKKGGKKKKGIKDVVSQEDFEVVIFLKDLSSRHTLLTKQKTFAAKAKAKPQGAGNSMADWLNDKENPITLEDEDTPANILQEEEDDVVQLNDIPEINAGSKRKASNFGGGQGDALFVSSDAEEDAFVAQRGRRSKQQKRAANGSDFTGPEHEDAADENEKKKSGLNTSFHGFSIYGRTLCLVVKRKGKKASSSISDAPLTSNQMMEQWVSTQAAQDAGIVEDDDG